MFEKKSRPKFSGLFRIACSVLLITFALSSGACSSGSGSDSSSVTGSAQ